MFDEEGWEGRVVLAVRRVDEKGRARVREGCARGRDRATVRPAVMATVLSDAIIDDEKLDDGEERGVVVG